MNNETGCRFPDCKNPVKFKIRDDWNLCEEHYNLYKFIDAMLFEATMEINVRRSRFE